MANRTDGSSALQDIDQTNFSGSTKVFNIDDYRKNKNPVEQKVVEVSEKITKNLNGDDNLKNEIESKIKSIIGEEEVKTSGEEIKDLIEVISKNLIVEDKKGTEIEVKKIKIELDRWKEENMDEVIEFKKEEFRKNFINESKKINPNLKTEELNKIREYGGLISEIYLTESIIDGQKDEALQANNQVYSPGKLENSWTDLRGVTNFLAKKPEEIKNIKNRYESIRGSLKNINLPENIKEVRSFENVVSMFNDKGVSNLFSKTQGYLGWADRIDKLTGGWLKKTTSMPGQGLTNKIGNQVVGEFAKNSLNVIAEQGFQKGVSTILSGILSGGVKAVGSAATTGAVTAGSAAAGAATAAGAAAVSATGIGAIVVAALAVLKVVKNAISNMAEKLGIGFKKGLEENFGKVGGAIINGGIFMVGLPFLLIGTISAVVMTPILLLVFGGLFGYQMLLGNSVSSLVPPEGAGDESVYESDISNTGGVSDADITNATCSVANKVILANQCSSINRQISLRTDGKCSNKTICDGGCGPTSVSEILQTKSETLTPGYLVTTKSSPYYNDYVCGTGTSFKAATDSFNKYLGQGSASGVLSCDKNDVKEWLCQNKIVMVNFKWNGGGHYAVAVAIAEDGELIIKDPGNGKINKYPSDLYYSKKGKTIKYCILVDANSVQ